MTDIDKGDDIVDAQSVIKGVADAPLVANRRSVWGRLYHGETSIDFYGRRWIGLGFSIVMLLISVGSLVGNGLNLSLEFKGGVSWTVPSATLTEDAARTVLNDQGLQGSNAKVQEFINKSDNVRTLEVQVGEQPDAVRRQVQQAFADEVGVPTESVSTQAVSSTWGKSITEKAPSAWR